MIQLAYMFGGAISVIVLQGIIRRLFDHSRKHYVRELNPPETKSSGIIGYYRQGLD